jgi:hypothetical protein
MLTTDTLEKIDQSDFPEAVSLFRSYAPLHYFIYDRFTEKGLHMDLDGLNALFREAVDFGMKLGFGIARAKPTRSKTK